MEISGEVGESASRLYGTIRSPFHPTEVSLKIHEEKGLGLRKDALEMQLL